LRLHRPVAVADLAVGRKVETAVAPQRLAPAQVEQARARIVRRAHVEIAGTEAAPTVEVDTQGRLLAAPAEADVRRVDHTQVGVLVAALQALPGKTVALAAVLITEAELVAPLTFETALTDGAVEHAEIAQAQVAADAAEGQRIRRFGMAFQGKAVTDAVAQAAGGDTGAVAEVLQTIIAAQRTGSHGKIAQAFLQQTAGDIERHRRRDLPPQRIGGHHHRLTGAVDERNVGQGIRPRLQVVAAGLVAVDKQIYRGRHRRFPSELRQRIGHQIRTHGKVPRELHTAQTHRVAPGQGAADHVAAFVGEHSLVIRISPGGVVAQVAVVQRTERIAGQGAPVLPGVGQGAPAVEQPQLVPGRQIGAGVVGVIEVQVIIEQRTETAQRRSARIVLAIANELVRQPLRRNIQQQALTDTVVLAVQSRQAVKIDFVSTTVRQFHPGFA